MEKKQTEDKKFEKKDWMKYYDETNFEKARGTTFKFFDDEELSDNYGQLMEVLLADISLEKGYTIKNIDNPDPDSYVWCLDNNSGRRNGESEDQILYELLQDVNAIASLVRVQDLIYWSDFVRASNTWEEKGSGPCPF